MVFLCVILGQDQTRNAQYCRVCLQLQVRYALREKHPKLAENTILHDNASAYSADAVRNAVWYWGVEKYYSSLPIIPPSVYVIII